MSSVISVWDVSNIVVQFVRECAVPIGSEGSQMRPIGGLDSTRCFSQVATLPYRPHAGSYL